MLVFSSDHDRFDRASHVLINQLLHSFSTLRLQPIFVLYDVFSVSHVLLFL
ncbi:unnamed protein product [Schistosoma mattheei]|uniref:Uncharacterized protein n=1 Tax=Schistosoma mattheei TaxID=31246 RepID=A0A3P8JXK1_9TREM|nr:unnamed protein product [Schistosoma mattheei]